MQILFLGDSLVEFHNWQARFPHHAVTNAGRAGETVAGLLADLPRILHRCPKPERVIIMIGANDLLMEQYGFIPEYEKILDVLGSALPAEQITVTSLPPIRATHLAPSSVPRINESLSLLSRKKKTAFLDLFAAFPTESRSLTACFDDDGVHLSDLGYDIWSTCLAPNL